ncbi:MAG: 4-hydroxyphenylpyruvate dioxygenase [Gammaproteobacteria bacterium]|nr:4-hydroxyphenylpyruvate dioxygenase [Gammaproteobacteria bacterium]
MSKTDNAIGTDGFEFVEFACENPESLQGIFTNLGFNLVGKHRSKNVLLYKQNDIHFLINAENEGQPHQFAQTHGDSANAFAIRVADANHATKLAIERGAKPVANTVGPMELSIPAFEGVGGSYLYLVDRYGDQTIYDVDFELDDAAFTSANGPLTYLDHLTHNLYRGNLTKLADFYEKVFEFHEAQYFQIHGVQTGLTSKAMTSSCGNIRIPLNESADDKSQIEEFLHRYNGEGIQHIALHTNNIFDAVDVLRAKGVEFQSTPDTYYEALNDRVKGHGESVEEMRKRQILLDGSPESGYLLQIFTVDLIGPIFFEIIQRRGNQGFGEGNFQALFESIERDQQQRGVLSETV